MPDFNTVNRGTTWSGVSGRSSDGRVETGTQNRPDVELKLSGRKVEIRTGSRVKRARGPWTSFKRAVNWASSWRLSKSDQAKRTLMRAEWRFDRHVNRLVEDLANKPYLSSHDITKRFNGLADEAAEILKSDPQVTRAQLAQRFTKNFEESLYALARRSPRALERVLSAFQENGLLDDLGNEYTAQNSPDREWMEEAALYDPLDAPPLTATQALKAGILEVKNPKQHSLGMLLIGKLASMPDRVGDILERASLDELRYSAGNGAPFTGTVRLDLTGNSELRNYLNQNTKLPTEKVGDHQVVQRFLRDLTRARMELSDGRGTRVEIREQLMQRNMTHGTRETDEFATGVIDQFAGVFGFEGTDRSIAVRNITLLMNQEVAGSLHVPSTKMLFESCDGVGLLNAPQKEKVAYNFSIDKNGDLICRSTKSAPIGTIQMPKFGALQLDPNRTNESQEVLTLRVKREDLAKDPLKYEILEAGVSFQLDTRGARKA